MFAERVVVAKRAAHVDTAYYADMRLMLRAHRAVGARRGRRMMRVSAH